MSLVKYNEGILHISFLYALEFLADSDLDLNKAMS